VASALTLFVIYFPKTAPVSAAPRRADLQPFKIIGREFFRNLRMNIAESTDQIVRPCGVLRISGGRFADFPLIGEADVANGGGTGRGLWVWPPFQRLDLDFAHCDGNGTN
jgi:hypothetical protein